MKLNELVPEFVDNIPRTPEPGKLYLSCRYRAVIHMCPCGCGAKISTPLHSTGWRLSYDGISVSLWPSVGNWSEKCQSHYWITENRVVWSSTLPRHEILQTREARDQALDRYFANNHETGMQGVVPPHQPPRPRRQTWVSRLWSWATRLK